MSGEAKIVIQYINGIPYNLKEPFDFSFLKRYGKVFEIFDKQESGNICFGLDDGKARYFLKFAGASTIHYPSDIPGAIQRLKDAIPVYHDLAHPALIRLIQAEEISGGILLLFDWVDDLFKTDIAYTDDYTIFQQLSAENRLRMFEDILDFHKYAAQKGYVATDFYDKNIMWDCVNQRTVICDIDFYSKTPWPGMSFWESSVYAAPEERIDGGIRDEITNVYNMGATAFVIFTANDRSPAAWPFNPALYAVVKRAVSEARADRQQSIQELLAQWHAVKVHCLYNRQGADL